jgi:hypothetical protein
MATPDGVNYWLLKYKTATAKPEVFVDHIIVFGVFSLTGQNVDSRRHQPTSKQPHSDYLTGDFYYMSSD